MRWPVAADQGTLSYSERQMPDAVRLATEISRGLVRIRSRYGPRWTGCPT